LGISMRAYVIYLGNGTERFTLSATDDSSFKLVSPSGAATDFVSADDLPWTAKGLLLSSTSESMQQDDQPDGTSEIEFKFISWASPE